MTLLRLNKINTLINYAKKNKKKRIFTALKKKRAKINLNLKWREMARFYEYDLAKDGGSRDENTA